MALERQYNESFEDFLNRRRAAAADLFERGLSVAETARQVGVCRQRASGWKQIYDAHGKEGLRIAHLGSESRLSPEQKQHIRDRILEGPLACDFENSLWTLARLAQMIENETGVHYHPSYVWFIMRDLGFTCQKPATKAKQRHDDAIQFWVEKEWPRIKRGHKARKGHHLFR